MFFGTLAILLIYKLFLAGKDASSYLLKDKNATGEIITKRIQRWHRDGIAIDLIFTLVLAWAVHDWNVIIQSLLVRLAVFDLAFNYWSSLNIHYLGSTALADRIFIKIFGINGAVTKSICFLAALIVWGLIKLII
jgi:hypothetical protein